MSQSKIYTHAARGAVNKDSSYRWHIQSKLFYLAFMGSLGGVVEVRGCLRGSTAA